MGDLGVGLQRARPRADLPVLELRRARPRPEAGPQRRPRRRALRDGARPRWSTRRPRVGQPRASRAASAPAARTASTRRSTTRRRGCPKARAVAIVASLHGAPPGHDARRARQRPARRRDARALPRRARSSRRPSCCCRSGRRGTCAVARPRAEEVAERRRRARARAAGPAPLHLARTTRCPRTHLLSNGRYSVMVTAAGSGYSRWRRPRRHPLARGRHPRLLGHATSSCATSTSGAVWSAGYQPTRRRARQLRGRRSPRTTPSSRAATAPSTTALDDRRVSPEDDAEIRRVVDHEPRRRRPARSR